MDEKQKPLYELYTELPEFGYQVAETYEEFEKAFTTDPDAENNRHALFEELKEQGLGPEDYETFYSTLFQPKDANTSVAIDPNAPKPSTQPQTKQTDQKSNGTATNVVPGTGPATETTDKVAAAKGANNSLLGGSQSITSVLDNMANDAKQAVTTPTDPQLTQSAQSASMQHGQPPTVVSQQEKARGYNVWKTKINNAFDTYAQGKIDDKQFKSTIESVAKDIESRTGNNEERNEFNTFIKDLQKRAQNTRNTKSVQVKAGYEAFPDNSDSVVWDFKLSRKQLPHQQDYVRTLRNMVTGGQSFNVMYNVTDPEIQRDYQIVSDPKAESTYKPNDYILGESEAQKDRDYQLYAAYLYLNGGDLPDWLDYTAQNNIKALSKKDLETKANQWKSLVDGTRTKRKYKGQNSIADYYASQNTFSTGEARATRGNRFATIVLPNGTYQTVDIHDVKGDQASVGDARKAFNARFNSTETADGSGGGNAQAPKGDTYLMPTIFNEERYSNSFPEWDDLDDKTKAQFDNSVFKYWDEMNKRQAISVPVFVANGKSVDRAEDEFNAKNAKTQFAQLTKREEIESQLKHAKKLREQLETAYENLRQSAREERGGGVSTMLGDAGQFRAAFHNIDNFIEAGERAIKDRHYSAFASFWENFSDADGWTLGLTGLNEALGLNHLASGEGVNPEIEKAFGGKKGVKEFAAAVQYFGQKSEQWRQKLGYYDEAGKAGLIQFMGSSLLPTFKIATVAGNAAKGVIKYLGKYAVRALDKGVAETASAGVRAVSQSAINRSLKTALKEGGMAAATRYGAAKTLNVGVNATALAAQGFTDGTILSVPEVFTNVANYSTGNAQVAEITREGIKFGDKLFVHDDQKSERDVIKETFQRGQAEWMGMRLGEIFGPWSRYLDQHMMSWGKTAYKKTLGKFLDGSNLDKTLGMIAKGAKATDVYKFVTNRFEQAGMGGSLTFYAQNNLSQLINVMTVGDMSVGEALSGKKGNNISWADMTWGQIQKAWGAVIDNAIVCGVHTTIGAASYKKQCFDLARLQRKNEKECSRVLGEDYWSKLKHDIDLCGETSDKALIAYTRAIKDNTDLSDEAKQAIINYAVTFKTQQALNYGALNNGKTNALDLRYQEAYDAGADVKSPDEISKLQENANSAKESLAKLLGCSTDEVDSKVKGFGEGYREIYEAATKDIPDEQKKKEVQNALDVYFTNLAAVEGAHDVLIIDHEQKLEQNKSYVEQNSNKESETTIQATDKDGRIWYVISGDPRSTNSSDMLIVRDGVTGEIGHGSASEFEFASEQNTQDLVNEGNKSISEEYLSKRNAILKGETLPERGDKVSVLDANGKVIEVTVEGIEQSETDGTPTGITVRTEDGQMYNFTTDEYRNAVKGVAERETATYIKNDNSALNRAVSSSQIATGTEFVHNGKRYTFDHIDDKGNWVARPVGQEGHLVEFSEEEVRTGIDDLLNGKDQDSEQSETNIDEEIKVGTEFTFEDGTPGVVTEIKDDGTIFIASKDSPVSFGETRERVAELIAKSNNAEQATDAIGEGSKTQDSPETATDDRKKQTAADISVDDEITINGHTYKVEGIDGNKCAIEKDGRRYIWRVSDIEKGIEDGRVKINAETKSTDAAGQSSEAGIAPGERTEGESATGLSSGNKIPEGEAVSSDVSSDQETDKVETSHTNEEESSAEVKSQPQEGQTIVTGEKPKEVPATEASIDHHTPALNRIPKDEKGEPMFEKAPLDQSYDALLEQTGGSAETTSEVIKEMIEDKRKALADAESEEIPHADGAMAKIAARKAHDEKVKQARQELEYWENLARVPEERKDNASTTDEHGVPFVTSSDGNVDFGQITESTGLEAAPIRLSEGVVDEKGNGYGLKHIEVRHGAQIRNAGFASVKDFVKYVAENYDKDNVKVGKRRADGSGTYLIQVEDGHSNVLYIELSRDGKYWNVNSGGVFRKGYAEKKENVERNSEGSASAATTQDQSFVQTDSKNGSESAVTHGDSQRVSVGKDTNEDDTTQTSPTEKSETDNKNTLSDQVSEASKGVGTESTGSKKTNARKTDGEPHAHSEQPLTERTRQACESVAKSLGIDVEWVDHLSENGEFDPNGKNGRPVIRIARDAENPLSTVFGHEGTHAVRSISEEAYKSLVDKARAVVGEEEWNQRLKDAKELYEDDHLTDDQIVEEVVADIVGEMITNRDMAEKLAYRLDHPTLSALRDVARKMWETVKRFVGGNKLTAYEQAVKDFADTIERAFADAQKVYADEVATPSIEGMATRFGETFTDYRPQSVPWGSGTLTDKANAPKRYSQRQIIKGAGLDVDIEKDGKVTFSLGGRKFDKTHHLTVDDVKSIDSPLNALVNTCVKNGSLKDPETVFEKYTDFLNRVLDKGDKGFEYLSDQWAWSGEALYKSVSNNSDAQYTKSVDITRVCKKNEAVINAICELQLQQRYGVTPGQVLDLYNASIEQDFQVPCPVCYVFSRYINNGQYASALIQGKELYGDKIKDTSKMTPAQRQKYVQGWLDELSAIKQWKTEHKNEIAEAKRNLSTIMQTVDALAEDITSGKLTGALRANAEKKIRALNKLYQESLNLVNYASLDGWITNFAIFKKGGKGTAEETTETDTLEEDNSTTFDVNEWHPYEDTYREGGEIYPDEVALDLRRAAEASVEYPGIERFRHTRGAAAGKAIQLAADNALGETAELLGIANPEDRKNNYSALQKAYAEASPEARAKLMKMHEDRIKKSIVYAARQTLRGGIRQWSWSDNIERLSPDVFVNLMQIHMIGGALQAYSKQLEGVELVAAMNGYVNGSLMGKGIGYKKVSADYDGPKYYNVRDGQYYTLVFDNVVGIEPFDHDGKHGLFYLNQMYDRAGNIIVGMDDIHVRACMADPRIFFIIPWHKSGMTNHILMQMYSYLGVPLDGLEGARDYTDVQEEKKYTEKSNVPSDVQSFWESHNYNDKFRSGIGTIESGRMVTSEDGKTYLRLSEAQLHYRELRNALLEHNSYDANDKFWAEHQDWLQEIEADEFLSQVRKKVKAVNDLGETMTSGDTNYVYPYEYWDMNSTFDTADVNGQRYLEYCRRMGFQPKFTGIAKGKFTDFGNFADEPGYWKLLIDRRMYDRQGKFQDLTPVTLDGFTPDLCDPEKTGERFNVTRVADDAKTKDIVGRAQEMERERGYAKTGRTRDRQFVPTPKYDSSSTYASRAAKRDAAAQRYNKAALADARVLADAKSILEGKAKDAYEKAKAKGNVSEERLAQLEKEYKDAKREREKAQKAAGTAGVRHSRRRNPTPEERAIRDELANTMKDAGIDVSVDDEVGQKVMDAEREMDDVRMEAKHHSEEAERRNRTLSTVDNAISIVSGRPVKEVRAERKAREEKFKAETKDLYDRVLSGNFDDVTLQRINDYLDNVTPNNEFGRRISKRLPQEVVRRVRKGERASEVDVLFSRISESAVPANERTRPEAKRRIEEKKKELLKGWAIATGNWHTSVEDFTHNTEPIGSGKDSVVYQSDDGKSVIKVSAGKDNLKKFRPDIDAITLFNHVFRNSPYKILGYGEVDGKFVKFLKQPIVDFTDSTPLSAEERVRYMDNLGFKPMNEERTAFTNGTYVVADLQGNNIVRDKAGNIRVIDADVKLHTKDFGGKYQYPAVETDFPADNGIREQRVYHGSGADFDHFDHSHMGEGEGAQVYGWGTYVTEVEGIGRMYARASNQSTLQKEKLKSDISRARERLPFMKGEYKTALEKEIVQKEEELSKISDANHHLYTVEIPDDNGSNYLDWTKEYSEKDVYSIVDRLLDVAAAKEKDGNLDDYEKFRDAADHIAEWVDGGLENDFFNKLTGANIYRKVAGSFEDYSEEEASKLLSEAGFTGIKYPAENMRGGRADGAKDYVVFNEADAKITDHIRFFRTPNGEAYGFTLGGKIYIDPRIAKADTPIHEYTHLWATALRQGNPEEWANVVNLMKGEKELWDEVKRRYPELKTDDEIADEVLAHYSGKRGAERLREEQRKIAEGEGTTLEKARAIRALENVKRALDKFWKGVADFLHIHYTSAEEVADRVMSDLLNGVNPTKYGTDNKVREQYLGEKGAENLDGNYVNKDLNRMGNKAVAEKMEKDGKDDATIKIATGWERGADGKWRYEIPDFTVDFEYAQYCIENGKDAPLWRVARETDLFLAYPELGDIPVKFAPRSDEGGHYDPNTHEIVVSTYGKLDQESFHDVLIHEVQHAIQDIEGFNPGANPQDSRVKSLAAKADRYYMAQLKAQASVKGNLKRMSQSTIKEKEEEAQKEYDVDYLTAHLIVDTQRRTRFPEEAKQKIIKQLVQKCHNTPLEVRKASADIINDPDYFFKKLSHKAFDVYMKNMGEVEARNVETRRLLSDFTRRHTIATDTEDIPRDKQLFVYGDSNGGGKRHSRRKGKDHTIYGGNSGYVGHSMSKRAAEAREEGRYPKNDFRKTYEVSPKSFDALVEAGIINDGEWHHTSVYGNKTTFYGWDDIDAQIYAENKAEIDGIVKQTKPMTFDEMNDYVRSNNPFKRESTSKEYNDRIDEVYRWGNREGRKINAEYESGTTEESENERMYRLNELRAEEERRMDDIRRQYPEDALIEANNKKHSEWESEQIANMRNHNKNLSDKLNKFFEEKRKEYSEESGVRYSLRSGEDLKAQYKLTDKEKDDATKRIDERIADLHRQREMEQSLKSENGNFAESHNDSGYLPRDTKAVGAQSVVPSGAKVENKFSPKESLLKNLSDFISNFGDADNINAENFPTQLFEGFGFKQREEAKDKQTSLYVKTQTADGEKLTIRLSDHSGNALSIIKKGGRADKGYSIVIETPSSANTKFKPNKYSKVIEFVYKNPTKERLEQIAKGVFDLVDNGEYIDLADADEIHSSPKIGGEPNGLPAPSGLSVTYKQNENSSFRTSYGTTTEKESPEAKTAAADTLSKEMNLQGNVTVLTSTDGLTGKKASAPGWCDPKTGHITIVLPNNADAADVQKTVFHEAVGHHGLRRLVGDGNFNDFLDNVYNNAEQGITQAIDQLAKEKHQGDRRKATEEYMSTLAEDGSFLNAGNRSLFQKVKQLFTDLLRKAGINLGTKLTDNDLRYILWKSYKNLTDNGNPDVFSQAEDIAKQNHLKVGDYAKHETAAEREINNADNERGLLFRTPSAPNNDPMNVASSYYNQKAETLGTKTLFGGLWAAMRHPKENGRKFLNEASESFFDYSRSVKALQDGIAKALGRPIRDDEDAWRTMNTLPAVNQEQLNAVQNNLVAPLGEHIGNIIKNTKDKPGGARTMDDVEIYLNCKHALERNKAMAERNAEEVMDKAKKNLANMMDKAYAEKLRIMASGDQQAISDYNKEVSNIKSRMAQGKRIADSEYAKVAADQLGTFADRKGLLVVIGQTADAYIDASRDQYVEAQRRDYSGLTEIFHPDYKEQRAQGVTYDVNDLEDEAQNLVAQFEGAVGKADIDELWKLVGNLTDFALRKSYVSGNISLQQYQSTKAMYANYVPLRGWNSKNADDVYNYVSGGNGLTPEDFQKVMKKAYGRESRAGYIFGTMIDMATTAVSQGNRNVMKQCLLNLAERSQTNLLRAGEVVYEQSSNGTLTPVLPKVHDGMTEQEIADAYSDWQDDVKNGLANGTYIRINSKLKTGFNAPQWEEDQHQIVVNRNGKKYIVYVNGNPRAAQAVNGLLDFTSDYNATEKRLLRHFAAVQTSFSPEFVVSNAQRDLATAAASGFIKEGAGYTKDFVANYFKIMPGGSLLNGDAKTGTEKVVGIYDLIRRYDRNELDLTNDTDRYYYEFCTNGGKTGITNLRRIEDYQEQVDKMTREVQNKYGTMPRRAVKGILDAIEYINAGVENATRFATYMTSRQRGKSVKQSIHDAKECSVNFNAHGSGAWMDSFFRKHYNYANAVFQSLRMNKEWMKSDPKRYTGVVAGALAMGMLSALLGTAICGGNDDDENGYYGLSEWNRYRFFNIPVAKHGFLHYALPQEFRGMFGTGASIVDLINGKITTDHFVKTLMSNINDFSVVPFYDDDAYNLASGDMSIPGMLVKGFIPTAVAPITDAYLYNRDFLGRPITNATSNNQQAPEWQRAGKDTPQAMIDASKWLNEHTGGQPNRRGGLENATGTMLNPSAIWYIIEQVGGGTMTFATKMKKTFEAMLTGDTSELKVNDIPFAGKFYVSSGDDKSKQRTINEQYNGITQDFKNLDYELRKNWRGKNITDGEFNLRMRELMDEGQVELWDSIVGNEHAIKKMQRAIRKNPDDEELKKELDSLIYQNKVEIVHKYEAWKKKYHK